MGELAEAARPSQEHGVARGLRAGAAGARPAAGLARRHPPRPGAARAGAAAASPATTSSRSAATRWSGWARRAARRSTWRCRCPAARADLDQVDSRHFLGTGQLGRPPAAAPLHVGGQGASWRSARRPPPARSSGSRPRRSPTADRLEESCAAFARRGYAITVGELEPGLVAVAAPVLGGAGGAGRRDQHLRAAAAARPGPLQRWATCWSRDRRHSPSDSATTPDQGEPHDTRRDPPGAVRGDAGRQRAGGQGADERRPGRRAWTPRRCSTTG